MARPALAARIASSLAGGIGAACAETTRYAVRWVAARHHAEGPVSDLVNEIAESDDLVPILAVALLFALAPAGRARSASTRSAGWGSPSALGLLLGTMAALLLGATFRLAETWGVLLGMSLLAVGTAERLGLSSISALFVMGVTLSALSPHRRELRRILAPDRARGDAPRAAPRRRRITDFSLAKYLPFLVAVAIVARIADQALDRPRPPRRRPGDAAPRRPAPRPRRCSRRAPWRWASASRSRSASRAGRRHRPRVRGGDHPLRRAGRPRVAPQRAHPRRRDARRSSQRPPGHGDVNTRRDGDAAPGSTPSSPRVPGDENGAAT